MFPGHPSTQNDKGINTLEYMCMAIQVQVWVGGYTLEEVTSALLAYIQVEHGCTVTERTFHV
jgi:hypothetical protein